MPDIELQKKRLGVRPMSSKTICELVKRRLKQAGLPARRSPHSLRETARTNPLAQDVPLEDEQ